MISYQFKFFFVYHLTFLIYIKAFDLILQYKFNFYSIFNVVMKVIYLVLHSFIIFSYSFEYAVIDYLFFYLLHLLKVNIMHLNMNLVVLILLKLYEYFFGFFLHVINSIVMVYYSLTLKLYHYYILRLLDF
jgi:hypothetical protein